MKNIFLAISILALTSLVAPAAQAIAPLPPKSDQEKIQEKIDKAEAQVEKFQEELLRELGKIAVPVHEANRL